MIFRLAALYPAERQPQARQHDREHRQPGEPFGYPQAARRGGQQAGHPAGQEEIAFRGVLQGALRRVLDEPVASAVGAAVFGLWHIRPTAEALAVNGLAAGRGARILAVSAVVAGTAGAGAVLSLLRERSGSQAAPVLLHLAANCAGQLASVLARPTDDSPR